MLDLRPLIQAAFSLPDCQDERSGYLPGLGRSWQSGKGKTMDAEVLEKEIEEAERKAVDALARYKFQMFGYWAAIWVHLNRIEGKRRPSPFAALVKQARALKASAEGASGVLSNELSGQDSAVS